MSSTGEIEPKLDEPVGLPPVLDAAVRDLVTANRILAKHGVLDAFGHISVRHPENPKRYFMSCSRGPALVSLEDILEFNLDGSPIDKRGKPLYGERAIHGSIYAARPDVNSICHSHAAAVIPFGVTGTALKPIFHMGSVMGSEVPIWDIRDQFGDTSLLVTRYDMGASLARALAQHRVVLMRGHGSVVVGASLKAAVFTAIFMQENASLQMHAEILGTPRYLTQGEIDAASAILFGPLSEHRAWQTWAHEAGCSVG